jgi:hypothetical protein
MSLDRCLHLLEQAVGQGREFTHEEQRILDWLSIWRLTSQKRTYLQSVGRGDLIERAEALQPLIEDTAEQRAFLDGMAAQGVTTLENFLSHQHHKAHQRAQDA